MLRLYIAQYVQNLCKGFHRPDANYINKVTTLKKRKRDKICSFIN